MAKLGYVGIAAVVVILTIASWLPGSDVVPLAMLSRHQKHFFAYLFAGMMFAGVVHRGFTYLQATLMLMALAGMLELGQNFVPRRQPDFWDFAVSAMGAWVGVFAIRVLRFGLELLLPPAFRDGPASSFRGLVLASIVTGSVAVSLYLHTQAVSSQDHGLGAIAGLISHSPTQYWNRPPVSQADPAVGAASPHSSPSPIRAFR
jgi:VanZ family protein